MRGGRRQPEEGQDGASGESRDTPVVLRAAPPHPIKGKGWEGWCSTREDGLHRSSAQDTVGQPMYASPKRRLYAQAWGQTCSQALVIYSSKLVHLSASSK